MMKSQIAAAAALLVVAGAASAGASVTATWVSDYDWRGITQTGESDAVQLSGTYTADSGFYAGLWGSSLPGSTTEIDEFAGYAFGDSANALGYDLGVNYYSYPNGKDGNFGELYAGISHGPLGLKVWWSPDFGGKTTSGHQSSFYVEGNGTFSLPMAGGLSLLAHVGYSDGDGIKAYYGEGKSYVDWSAGFGYDVGNFSTFLKYVDGSDVVPGANDLSRFIFGVSTTLPWK